MRVKGFGGFIACVAFAGLPLLLPAELGAQTPAPPPNPMPIMPPQLPAARVVDLMTEDGIKIFGGQWKNMDVKIVEAPPREGAGPKWTSSYDIQPHAGEKGFDDSKWPAI